jgi:hypothetical protein
VWQQALRQPGKFVKHIIPGIIRPLHALWNEVIGFLFLCFAAFFGFKTATYVRQYQHASAADAPGLLIGIVMTGFFGLLMAYFGISSFLKARKISRS